MAVRKRGIRKLVLLVFWPLGALLSWLTAYMPYQVEDYYASGFSKAVSKFLSLSTGIIPFSLAEVLVWLLAIGLLCGLIRLVVCKINCLITKKDAYKSNYNSNKKGPEGLFSYLYKILVFLGAVYFCFILIWGLNYNRLSFAEIAGFGVERASDKELEELCEKLIIRANDQRSSLNEDEQGVLQIEGKFLTITSLAPVAFSKAATIYPELGGEFGKPKPVFFSVLMSYTGISGIYFPFTGEANVNVDIPDSMLPATTCHEMAHQRGFAREDEASYIAWVVCNNSGDPVFRYSGTLSALIYAMNALYDNAPDRARVLQEKYSAGVRRDLQEISEYWKKYEGKIEEVTSDVNDAYLKSNRQEEGIKSYGRMVDLLLAEQKADAGKRFLH